MNYGAYFNEKVTNAVMIQTAFEVRKDLLSH